MKVFQDYDLRANNTFGVSARCACFREYASEAELCEIITSLSQAKPRPLLHIGGGSNLLFTGDFSGDILHSAIKGRTLVAEDEMSVFIRVGAAECWDDIIAWSLQAGYYGLENLSLIPGEVGASAVQNIGAYGSEVYDFISEVRAVDLQTGQSRTFKAQECEPSYRSTMFKSEWKDKYAITYVTYHLHKTFKPNLSYAAVKNELVARNVDTDQLTAALLREIIIEIRSAKLPDPQKIGNAGSFFMNPVVTQAHFERLRAVYPSIPHYILPNGVKIPAAWLIETAGWKGKTLGQAGVYAQQALILVNLGHAKGQDIKHLAEAIQQSVKEKFDISLKPEVLFI
ncbi:UDP-N-acetylmuramate dehydrogenase [Alloprevotella tannerae]|uniref:UDP-N-acetylmuramate dehydrogenase n=1 Tax=Alloprevotella tannerae TaxID=76122 RepID=UPI0028D1EFCE|nr:UDP-N-acetylmuramate dehydrogenase [Alloprevotella tannerae]